MSQRLYQRMTSEQKTKLIELAESGTRNLKKFRGDQYKTRKAWCWAKISNTLNSLPGACKTPNQWEKTYKDATRNSSRRNSSGDNRSSSPESEVESLQTPAPYKTEGDFAGENSKDLVFEPPETPSSGDMALKSAADYLPEHSTDIALQTPDNSAILALKARQDIRVDFDFMEEHTYSYPNLVPGAPTPEAADATNEPLPGYSGQTPVLYQMQGAPQPAPAETVPEPAPTVTVDQQTDQASYGATDANRDDAESVSDVSDLENIDGYDESKSILKNKFDVLERIAKAQEAQAQAEEQLTKGLESFVGVLAKFLETR